MDIQKIKEFIDCKVETARSRNHERWLQARQDSEKILKMLKTDYKPKRIYCWGSLLDESKFNQMSDIDIAIEGITDPEKLNIFKFF